MAELETTIGALLKQKPSQVWTIGPRASVYEAIEQMAEKQVGALLVVEEGKLAGIVSERDYARKVILKGRSSKETPVSEIMTSSVISVGPRNTVAECMRIVTDKRIRHLPVLEDGRIKGMISIGDLVNFVIADQRETIRQLEAFITGVAS